MTTQAAAATGSARVVAGRYRVDRWHGAGASAAVWLGWDLLLDRPVALKELIGRTSSSARTLNEARAAAKIDHRSVVRIYDVVLDGEGGDWVVMEALEGRPLSSAIRLDGGLAVEAVMRIGVELLDALAEIHRHDIVHRDVKASNVILGPDDRVVLTDFGLAGPARTTGGARLGRVAGSVPYLAPEAMWSGEYSAASDVYALGVTLHVAMTGRVPFRTAPEDTGVDESDTVLSRRWSNSPVATTLAAALGGMLAIDVERRLTVAQAQLLLRSSGRSALV